MQVFCQGKKRGTFVGRDSHTFANSKLQGNCKFGPKCANIHVLPDGRRINYGKNGVTIGHGGMNLPGTSQNPTSPNSNDGTKSSRHAHAQSSTSALTNSLYQADHDPAVFPFDDRAPMSHLGRQPSLDNGIPIIDAPNSHYNSVYGSPRDDEGSNRLGLGLSPVGKGLSVLDAPLPASFDSNGLSNAAMFPGAPWPSSVPSKFGLESPSPSWSNAKDARTSETLKMLHSSAFGPSDHVATPIAGSPPVGSQPGAGEEYFGKRAMHSSRSFAKPRMLSASVPKTSVDRDWEAEFAFGDEGDGPENYVPENLQDLLTPAEKARRGSFRGENDVNLDGMKYGSPIGTSPGRWGPVFPRQKDDDDLSRSARGASAFGHVGSPLRNSTLAQEMGGSSRTSTSRAGSEPMSMLSQQLQRSHIDDGTNTSSGGHLHPASARNNAIPIGIKDRHMERHVSSGSISSAGRFATPIDEDSAFVFSMEEEDDTAIAKARKRGSSGMAMGVWPSYASAAAGKPNGQKDGGPVPVNGQ